MYEILKVDTQKSTVLLGNANGLLKEIELKYFDFLPQIGNKVEVFENENTTFIKRSDDFCISQNSLILPTQSVKGNKQTTAGEHVWPHAKAVWIKLFLVIGCILSLCLYVVPFFISLPLTINCWIRINSNRPISIGVKIGTLVFTSMVAGILLLTENDNNK